MNVNVLLSGKLRLDGYGRGKPKNSDGTYRLTLQEGSTVQDVIQGMGVPHARVTMTILNAHKCESKALVQPDDRIILVPSDVAALWHHLELMSLGEEIVCDF
jgi:hypothetical protein